MVSIPSVTSKAVFTMNNTPLISMVIPVYNVAPYLNECLESILSQASSRIEIILVDDGSSDGSGELCDTFTSDATSIRVIHKRNGGLASARNAGLNLSRGKYISFVDSDDRVAPGAISRLTEWAGKFNSDICFLGCEKFYPNGVRKPFGCEIHSADLEGLNADKALDVISRLDKFPDAAVIKLYKRSFLESHSIRFPDDGRLSEDLGFAIDCFLAARSFSAIDGPFYEYRQNREGSITSRLGSKHFFDLVTFVKESASKLVDQYGNPRDRRCRSCLSFIAYELAIMTWMLSVLDRADRRKGIEALKEYRWVLPYGRGRKARLTREAIRLFGFSGTSRILSIYMRLR